MRRRELYVLVIEAQRDKKIDSSFDEHALNWLTEQTVLSKDPGNLYFDM